MSNIYQAAAEFSRSNPIFWVSGHKGDGEDGTTLSWSHDQKRQAKAPDPDMNYLKVYCRFTDVSSSTYSVVEKEARACLEKAVSDYGKVTEYKLFQSIDAFRDPAEIFATILPKTKADMRALFLAADTVCRRMRGGNFGQPTGLQLCVRGIMGIFRPSVKATP